MLKDRVLTAIILVAGFLLSLFVLPQWAWLVLVALVVAVAAWEWGGLIGLDENPRFGLSVAVSCVVALLGAGLGLADSSFDSVRGGWLYFIYALSTLFWLAFVPLWFRGGWSMPAKGSSMLLGFVVLVPAALALAHLRLFSVWVLLVGLSLIWVADIAAYFSGRAYGRTKLAPSISPGKTREGAVGAGLAVCVTGCLLYAVLAESSPGVFASIGLVIALVVFTAVSIVGDLFESLVKRKAGVKDSGNLLPGHGGVLDRIDSVTSALPLFALVVLAFMR